MAQISVSHPGLPSSTEEKAASFVDSPRLDALIAEHLAFVWRSLRRLGVALSATDDATQQVWLVLARRLPEIEAGQERAFLFGTAMRVASDSRRRAAKRREVTGLEHVDAIDPNPTPLDLLARQQARGVLDQVLDTLPEDLRAVFVLYELEEQTAAQIAELLGIPPGTVASRLRRARVEFEQIAKRLKSARRTRPMTDLPERILSGGSGEWERALLESALLDAPTVEFKRTFSRRLSAALGAASVLTISGTSHALAGVTWLKWLALGFVVGTAGTAAGVQLSDSTKRDAPAITLSEKTPSPQRLATRTLLEAKTLLAADAARSLEPVSRVKPSKTLATPPARFTNLPQNGEISSQITASSPALASALRAEMARLEAIREALSRGQARSALRELDQYELAYPSGALSVEAHVLRIEALATAGEGAAAAALARRFLDGHRTSPYAKRVATLALSESGANP